MSKTAFIFFALRLINCLVDIYKYYKTTNCFIVLRCKAYLVLLPLGTAEQLIDQLVDISNKNNTAVLFFLSGKVWLYCFITNNSLVDGKDNKDRFFIHDTNQCGEVHSLILVKVKLYISGLPSCSMYLKKPFHFVLLPFTITFHMSSLG